ncbi:MAG: relaxase domain-containing protein [Myxococcales bacterium]
MLRIQPIVNAKQAAQYYSKSDAGYYMADGDLRREWVGRGAELLKLHDTPDYEQFRRLIQGLDPHSGSQLTAKLIVGRVPAWDINVHCAKGVTLALEQGDLRIQTALWEATKETIADLERKATTRVRKGKQQADRITGNLVGYAVEHAETRPSKTDKMPDCHRHIHVVCFNLTWDKKREQMEGREVSANHG